MRFVQLGNTDIKASTIALGTWPMGGWMWGGCDEKATIQTIQTAIDAGITTIDTAPMYGYGRAEELVGKAIRGRNRESVVIASKCGIVWSDKLFPPNVGEFHFYADESGLTTSMTKYAFYRWLNPDSIRREVEDSLRRLGTDYIDLMQIHHTSDKTTPICETMGALEELRKEGKIRAIGISNTTCEIMDGYSSCGSLDAVQERYTMLDRSVEKSGVFDACREKGATFMAYSSLENGLLTGKLDPERVYKEGDFRATDPKFSKENVIKVNKALEAIGDIARRYNINAGQFAAAWVASRYEKTIVLCGAKTPEQVAMNAQAGDAQLTSEDFEEVDSILNDFGLLEAWAGNNESKWQ